MEINRLENAIGIAKRRIVPFLLLMYVLAFLDRANIGFAKETFQISTGISNSAYALGASLFFISYAILEIPSNLALHKVGAKIWMCRIMVTWGLISAGMIFVWNETSFYIMRVLLGAAESGFFPGVILYLTYWFPDRSRGQIMGFSTLERLSRSYSERHLAGFFCNFTDSGLSKAGNGCFLSKGFWQALSVYGHFSTSITSHKMQPG